MSHSILPHLEALNDKEELETVDNETEVFVAFSCSYVRNFGRS
jgi:hypothetical protein